MDAVRVVKLNPNAKLPTYGSAEAAGADLYACIDAPIAVKPGEVAWVGTGIALEVPKGCAGLVYARSGLACKRGLAPANKVGVVDSDYRGEIKVALLNTDLDEPYDIAVGDRIAQLIVMPVPPVRFVPVDELPDSVRGHGGFGSSGYQNLQGSTR